MQRVMYSLRFEGLGKRQTFRERLVPKIAGWQLVRHRVDDADDMVTGLPHTNADVTHELPVQAQEHFDWVVQVAGSIPWITGEVTLHECDHALGGLGGQNCQEVIGLTGRRFVK